MQGFWLSTAIFALVLASLATLHRGLKATQHLADIPDELPPRAPRVSVVVSALDEEATIEPALRSLLALEYPLLEVIAIDDRSTDGTGAIMDRLAQDHPRLRVLHVHTLPAGWLGKNHALHLGAQAATGDYLLFTDADVVFEPRALRRAVAYCERQAVHHLVVFAEFIVREPLLACLLLNLHSLMFAVSPPWKVRNAPRVYMGMGAFNLVRTASYRHSGGHEALRLEVIDDLMLGRQMKMHGFHQDVLLGRGAVALEWYRDTAGLTRGLEKNAFAMMHYSVTRLAAFSAAMLLLRYWPLAGLFLTTGAAWWMNLGAVAASLAMHGMLLHLTAWPRRCLWWWPASALVLLYINWRGVILTLRRGGVSWRGTFYPLAELRRARRDQPAVWLTPVPGARTTP